MKKIRNSNFELLRILLTFMIIALHYTAQSGARDLPVSYNFIFTILVSSAGRMAVSCFVILGAFFLVDLDFRFERIVRIWLQSLFYTTIIHLILKYFQITEVSTKTLVMSLLPFYGLSLWYVSYYIGLLFLSPFLNVLIKNLSHQLYVALLVILLTLGSIIPSLIHLGGPLEHTFIWFCTLYLLAGYLKNIPFLYLKNN